MQHVPRPRLAGQALVEFALVGPIFFGMVLATIEAGLLMNAQISLDHATREAARVAALCGDTRGTWEGYSSTNPQSGGSPCAQAASVAFGNNLGLVAQVGTYPTITFSTPTDSANSGCQSSTTFDGAPQGCPIQVQTSYTYSFLLNFLLGTAAPGVSLSSQASVISQQ